MGTPLVTDGFPLQEASNAELVMPGSMFTLMLAWTNWQLLPVIREIQPKFITETNIHSSIPTGHNIIQSVVDGTSQHQQ